MQHIENTNHRVVQCYVQLTQDTSVSSTLDLHS